MKLRKLEIKDAPLMLEWMHDQSVVQDLQANFSAKQVDDCIEFINASNNDKNNNLHLAIVNDEDEYLGTVSLKHIHDRRAEFGIAIRKCAMGKEIAKNAMYAIISQGFDELHLSEIFWCVNSKNIRALKFYDKNNYTRVKINDSDFVAECRKYYNEEQIKSYIWYSIIANQ